VRPVTYAISGATIPPPGRDPVAEWLHGDEATRHQGHWVALDALRVLRRSSVEAEVWLCGEWTKIPVRFFASDDAHDALLGRKGNSTR
jgi:hypothetical protein